MPKGRVESFSDCVIAFAITLLILDVHLQDIGTNIDNAGMIHAITALRLLWLNSLYLMWIAFLPFPTGLLGNHPEQPVAVAPSPLCVGTPPSEAAS